MTTTHDRDLLDAVMDARPVLVLSPHMDDAMLSASAIVLDRECEVWTVFTGRPVPPQTTSWDLSCGFADSDATITARKDEDATAFDGTPARNRHLDFLEGAYATREQHRASLPLIEAEIEAWMSAHPNGVVVAPGCAGLHMPPPVWEPVLQTAHRLRQRTGVAGQLPQHSPHDEDSSTQATSASPVAEAGPASSHPVKRAVAAAAASAKTLVQRAMHAEHLHRRRRTMGEDGLAANPDHLALRDATLRIASRHPGVQIVLFEDLPYLWHARGDEELARLEKTSGIHSQRLAVPIDVRLKHERLAAYVSQLPVLDRRGRLLEAASLPDHEVFWVLDGA